MIELTCPQCRTKLPVAEEKIGKTLFVCPSCSFPLDAPNGAADPAPPVMAGGFGGYATPAPPMPMRPAVAAPMPAMTEITLTDAPPMWPGNVPVPAPRVRTGPKPPPAVPGAPASRNGWLIGVAAAGGAAVVAGVLFLVVTLWPRPTPETAQASNETPKMGLLEVLALSDDLQNEDPEKKAEAALALGEAGPDAKAAVPALLDALRETDDRVRILFANALNKIGAPAESDFPALSAALRDDDPDVRAYSLSVIDSLGEKSWGEIEQVRLLTQDEDPQVKAEAELTLERLEKSIVDTLIARLKDPDEKERAKAAESLGELGVSAEAAKASLMAALADQNEAVRAAVQKALAQFGAEVVPMLANALSNPNMVARRAAVDTLGSMKEDAADAIPRIAETVDDSDVGNEAARVLVRDFGDAAAPEVASIVGQTTVVDRRTFLVNKVLVPMGPAAYPAINNYVINNPGSRVWFNPYYARYKEYVAPEVVAPEGLAGNYYRDLNRRFREWENREGYLDHAKTREALKMDAAAYKMFLRRLDRDGDGRISKNEYQRWAHDHANQLAKEEMARKAVEAANLRLREKVAADRKKALQDARVKLKSINSEKAKHPAARKTAEASLNTQRHNAQKQHVSAQNAAIKQQHNLAKVQRHQSPVARQMAPHKPAPRPAAPRKPPTRPPVVHHGGGGHPAAGHAPKGGGGGKKRK